MVIVSDEWLTDEIIEELMKEESCYLSSDKEYWLFSDDTIFNKMSKMLNFDKETKDREYPVYSLTVAEWLYGKCEDNDLSTEFMETEYYWYEYAIAASLTINVSECCNNKWDIIMLNHVKDCIEEDIADKLKNSLRSLKKQNYKMEYIKTIIEQL